MKNKHKQVEKSTNPIKDFFEGTSRAAYFWNSLVYIGFIITLFINPEISACISGIASLLSVALWMDGEFDKNPNSHYWLGISIPFWFILFVGGLIFLGEYIYRKTIGRFNDWLNDPYKESFKKFQAHVYNPKIENSPIKNEFDKIYKESNMTRDEVYYSKPRYWNKLIKEYKSN